MRRCDEAKFLSEQTPADLFWLAGTKKAVKGGSGAALQEAESGGKGRAAAARGGRVWIDELEAAAV